MLKISKSDCCGPYMVDIFLDRYFPQNMSLFWNFVSCFWTPLAQSHEGVCLESQNLGQGHLLKGANKDCCLCPGAKRVWGFLKILMPGVTGGRSHVYCSFFPNQQPANSLLTRRQSLQFSGKQSCQRIWILQEQGRWYKGSHGGFFALVNFDWISHSCTLTMSNLLMARFWLVWTEQPTNQNPPNCQNIILQLIWHDI